MIHETAVIAKGAKLGKGVHVGPYVLVGEHVQIGDDTRIYGHCVLDGHTTIGKSCEIFPYASIGLPPQSKAYRGEATKVNIGDRVTLREQVSVHRGTVQSAGETTIGDDSYIMVGCHIAHDCYVGCGVQMANLVSLTGHVHLGNGVVCGGDTGFAPFVHIGDHSFVAASSRVRCHSPPYALIFPEHRGEGLLRSPNYIGMERLGKNKETITALKRLFLALFTGGGHYTEKIDGLSPDLRKFKEVDEVLMFLTGCPVQVNVMRMLTKYRRPPDEVLEED